MRAQDVRKASESLRAASLPDFIIRSKDRETKPAETQQKLETGFEKAWLSPLSYEM